MCWGWNLAKCDYLYQKEQISSAVKVFLKNKLFKWLHLAKDYHKSISLPLSCNVADSDMSRHKNGNRITMLIN